MHEDSQTPPWLFAFCVNCKQTIVVAFASSLSGFTIRNTMLYFCEPNCSHYQTCWRTHRSHARSRRQRCLGRGNSGAALILPSPMGVPNQVLCFDPIAVCKSRASETGLLLDRAPRLISDRHHFPAVNCLACIYKRLAAGNSHICALTAICNAEIRG